MAANYQERNARRGAQTTKTRPPTAERQFHREEPPLADEYGNPVVPIPAFPVVAERLRFDEETARRAIDLLVERSRDLPDDEIGADPFAIMAPWQRRILDGPMPIEAFDVTRNGGDASAYVPAWIADHLASRLFGDRWGTEVLLEEILFEGKASIRAEPDARSRRPYERAVFRVVARARVRVFVDGIDGRRQSHCAVGVSSYDEPFENGEIASAYRVALKGAVTDARRTALQHFGQVFCPPARDRDALAESIRQRRALAEAATKESEASASAMPAGVVIEIKNDANEKRGDETFLDVPAAPPENFGDEDEDDAPSRPVGPFDEVPLVPDDEDEIPDFENEDVEGIIAQAKENQATINEEKDERAGDDEEIEEEKIDAETTLSLASPADVETEPFVLETADGEIVGAYPDGLLFLAAYDGIVSSCDELDDLARMAKRNAATLERIAEESAGTDQATSKTLIAKLAETTRLFEAWSREIGEMTAETEVYAPKREQIAENEPEKKKTRKNEKRSELEAESEPKIPATEPKDGDNPRFAAIAAVLATIRPETDRNGKPKKPDDYAEKLIETLRSADGLDLVDAIMEDCRPHMRHLGKRVMKIAEAAAARRIER
jgi:hypothetical protein